MRWNRALKPKVVGACSITFVSLSFILIGTLLHSPISYVTLSVSFMFFFCIWTYFHFLISCFTFFTNLRCLYFVFALFQFETCPTIRFLSFSVFRADENTYQGKRNKLALPKVQKDPHSWHQRNIWSVGADNELPKPYIEQNILVIGICQQASIEISHKRIIHKYINGQLVEIICR